MTKTLPVLKWQKHCQFQLGTDSGTGPCQIRAGSIPEPTGVRFRYDSEGKVQSCDWCFWGSDGKCWGYVGQLNIPSPAVSCVSGYLCVSRSPFLSVWINVYLSPPLSVFLSFLSPLSLSLSLSLYSQASLTMSVCLSVCLSVCIWLSLTLFLSLHSVKWGPINVSSDLSYPWLFKLTLHDWIIWIMYFPISIVFFNQCWWF